MKEAGIEKHITYHSSRHSTATLAITAGADISAVKEILGHGSVTSTEVYANWRTKQKQRWACSIYALQGGRRRSQGKPQQENPGSQSYRRGVWVISTNKKNKGKRDFLFPLFVIYSAYEQCYFHKGLLSHPLVNPIMKTGTSGMEQNKSFMSSLTVLSGFMALQRYSRQETTPKARFLWCSVMSCTIHL